MFILSKNERDFINCKNVASFQMKNENSKWEIRAVYSSGTYIILNIYYTEQECKNDYIRLCDKVATSREYEVIYMDDLW